MTDDRVLCVHVHAKALDLHLHGSRAPGADEAMQTSGERHPLQQSAETWAAGKHALIRHEQGLPQPVPIARIGSRYAHDRPKSLTAGTLARQPREGPQAAQGILGLRLVTSMQATRRISARPARS